MSKYNSFTVLCHDRKGTLANISEIIAKGGANIKNIVYIFEKFAEHALSSGFGEHHSAQKLAQKIGAAL